MDNLYNMSKEEIKGIFLESFHQKIHSIMKEKGIDNDVEVYTSIGIEQSHFSVMQNYKQDVLPTIFDLYKLAKYFNVPMEYFLESDLENENKSTSWKNLTNKEVMEILIDMISAHQINVSTNKIDNHVIDGMVGYSANISFTDGYLPAKLHEWIELTKPIRENKHEYNEKILEVMKEGFLNSVNNEPFYDLPF